MSKKILFSMLAAALLLALVIMNVSAKGNGPGPGGGGGHPEEPGGGGHTEVTGNNLSFPALLADGYSVTDIPDVDFKFTVPYAGDYTGLTAEQIAYVEANGPWYAQKTEGNVWQADFANLTDETITCIDWGDKIEAVNPMLKRPYRLELVLYKQLATPMTAYTMALLANPSSKDEVQGTNTETYESSFASVASPYGKIVVQRTEGVDPETLTWDGTMWVGAEDPLEGNFGFQVENNVGGKLIFGASTGGWKPDTLGAYRITFYLENSTVNLSTAIIGNYSGISCDLVSEGETNTPHVDAANNLTYVDVEVVKSGGGGKDH